MRSNPKRPNLRSLESFEAVARHLSISKAAAELGVTQSAVSHQMRHLSREVGEKLFMIAGRRVVLTESGERLAERVRGALGQIDRSIADIVGTNRQVVRLAVCTSFAPGWLTRRIQSFYASYPEVQLQVRMYAKDPELTDQVADAFVTTFPTERGFWALRIRSELLVAVYAADKARLFPGKLPLITTTLDTTRTGDDWMAWCALAGRKLEDIHQGSWIEVSHYVTAFDMAKAGLGVALVPDFLVETDVEAGILRQLPDAKLPTREDYYLCLKEARRNEESLVKLVEWFERQVSSKSHERDS